MSIDKKLAEMFIELPEPATEPGTGLSAVKSGKLLFIGGVYPFAEGRLQFPGRVGVEVRLDNARMAARYCAIHALSAARAELGGSLDRIHKVVRVDGFISCSADFKDHIKVIDGASEFFVQIFGNAGKPVRTAIGAFSLPHNACVELAVIFEVK